MPNLFILLPNFLSCVLLRLPEFQMPTRQIIIGSLTWCVLGTTGWFAVRSQFADKPQGLGDVAYGVSHWLAGAKDEQMAKADVLVVLAPGDPILMRGSDGSWRQVGLVRNHFALEPAAAFTREASVILYDDAATSFPDGFVLEYHTTPTTLDWVVRTMIPPERQREIARLIADDWRTHRAEFVAKLQPLVERSLQITIDEIEKALPDVLSAHRSDFARLGDRYQVEIIRAQVVPLVREELLPIVEEEVRPVATALGKDLWNRVSVWAFTWRYLYDASPLPERNAVQKEFDRFIEQETLPALEAQTDEFVAATERIIGRISRNEKVRSVVRENLRKVMSDPELQAIIWDILQETLVENAALRTSLRDHWKSADVQDALQLASARFEPTARTIGDTIFGNRESGITPEFSRVLRSQILMKDRRWLVVIPKPGHQSSAVTADASGPLQIIPAVEPMLFPIDFEGEAQSPLTEFRTDTAEMP